MRRDHMKYLTLIRAIALLHQHQRPVKTARGVSYIEATREDIATADRLMEELLAPFARRTAAADAQAALADRSKWWTAANGFRFSRRDVRDHTGWGHTQLKIHLHRLEEMEYLAIHHGGRGQSFVYELNWSGSGRREAGVKTAPKRGDGGGWSASRNPHEQRSKRRFRSEIMKKAHIRGRDENSRTYPYRARRCCSKNTARICEAKNYSEYTIRVQRVHIGFFIDWAAERGITEPVEVTRTLLEQYRSHVFHYRKKNGEPLGFTSQQNRLVPLRIWFRWMAREHYILHNPASELELPRTGFRLPKAVLTAEEAEQILSQPNIDDPLGLRDRAILETLLLDRHAPLGAGALETVRPRHRARDRDHPPGQRQKGPQHSARRPRRAVGTKVSQEAGRAVPS